MQPPTAGVVASLARCRERGTGPVARALLARVHRLLRMVTTPSPDDNGWPPDTEVPADARRVVVPPFVYVPCGPVRSGDDDLTVDLRETREGQLALLAYTALDRLIECCGAEQPWAVMPTADLEKVREATGFEIVVFDVEIPPEKRRRAEVP